MYRLPACLPAKRCRGGGMPRPLNSIRRNGVAKGFPSRGRLFLCPGRVSVGSFRPRIVTKRARHAIAPTVQLREIYRNSVDYTPPQSVLWTDSSPCTPGANASPEVQQTPRWGNSHRGIWFLPLGRLYSTVTLFARFRGLSTSNPLDTLR